MSSDFYVRLEIGRSASCGDIKKAYKKLALKWHPLKQPESDDTSVEDVFQSLGEAYSVLSDKRLKAMYDQYGVDGLEDWVYKKNGHDIFEKFFGTKNPFANFAFGDEVTFAPRLRKPGPQKMEPIVLALECTLEELYSGCAKTYQVTRKRRGDGRDGDSAYVDEAKTLAVTVEPGWKQGTRITFESEGDAGPDILPADIVFELKEVAHPTFVRKNDDLLFVADISLKNALAGTTVNVPTLDGRTLAISCPEVVSPGYLKRVKGQGMPTAKGFFGDLIIRFRIHFPKFLSETKKSQIIKLLDDAQ